MKKTSLLVGLFVFSLAAAAQQSGKANPSPSGASGQSTVQGCVVGSVVTSSYVLTDEHTGEIYLLRGNEPLLKENVGHDVLITGIASAIRPSNRKGSIGYISPSEPNRTGDSSAEAGQKALNFEVTYIHSVADRCAQSSESQKAAIAASQAALGSVSGRRNALEPKVGSQAQAQPQANQQVTTPPVEPGPTQAATGKTGNEGSAMPVTTTGSAGHVTPGVETEAGKAQAPGRQTGLGSASAPVEANRPGAPPTPEQTAQNPADAERITSSAQRAEINNSGHQLGVNAQPNYQQNAAQQTRQANRTVTGAENSAQLPGASQHMESGRREREERAAERQHAQPTLIGCLQRGSGKDARGFFLTERSSGTRYRLSAAPEELKDHVNHLVEVVGKPAKGDGRSGAVAAGNEAAFDVSGVQDLAPACGAGH